MSEYDPGAEVEITGASSAKVRVAPRIVPAVIGRGGSNISALEKRVSMHIDVSEREANSTGEQIPCDYSESHSAVLLQVPVSAEGREADILVSGRVVAHAHVGKGGRVKIPRHSRGGKRLRKTGGADISIELRGA